MCVCLALQAKEETEAVRDTLRAFLAQTAEDQALMREEILLIQHNNPRNFRNLGKSMLSDASLSSGSGSPGQRGEEHGEPFRMGVSGLASPMRLVWTPREPSEVPGSPPFAALASGGLDALLTGTNANETEWLTQAAGSTSLGRSRQQRGAARGGSASEREVLEQMMLDRMVLIEEVDEMRRELRQAHQDNRLLVVEFSRLQELASRGAVRLDASVTGLQV